MTDETKLVRRLVVENCVALACWASMMVSTSLGIRLPNGKREGS